MAQYDWGKRVDLAALTLGGKRRQIRPWVQERSSWLFVGSLRSGQRAAAIMTLIQSAKLNGHDPYAYLMDVLTCLPTQKNIHHRRAIAPQLEAGYT